MNTPVSSEIAKLLKEHGYNKPCYHYYYNNKLESSSKDNWNDLNGYSAPTIAEVVMWLYEKHNIWIYAKGGYGWEFVIELADNSSKILHNDGTYKSPTEAYSAAIEYALKNLI